MNMRFWGIMVLAGTCMSMSAQTEKTAEEAYEEFRRQAMSNFEASAERQKAAYLNFRDSVNKAYADFLEQAWAEFKKSPAIPKPKDKEVKPQPMPEEDRNKPIENRPVIIEEVVAPVQPTPQPVPVAPVPKIEEPTEEQIAFNLYGTEMKVRFSEKERFTLSSLNEKGTAEAWRKLSTPAYNNTLRDCLALRLMHHLSDWAYLRLVEQVGKACLGESNEAILLTAYLYCQSGYQMRLGMFGQRLYMLYATDYSIYDHGCFSIDGTRFYVLGVNEPIQMMISKAEFPKEQSLSLQVTQRQELAMETSQERELKSKNHSEVACSVQVNKNLLAFFNDYPSSMVGDNFMTKWALYANTPLQKEATEQLYPALRKHIDGKSQKEAVGLLLDFVQTAFVYEYDEKVWGHDRVFFAEETLFYPYADCEDRSILFSRLVRDLLGLKVVLVYYPGHLAAAVQFTEEVAGDFLMVDGKRFVVCDPTYINAPIGMTMPNMDNQKAKVILLE